jgi:hypothetical protein
VFLSRLLTARSQAALIIQGVRCSFVLYFITRRLHRKIPLFHMCARLPKRIHLACEPASLEMTCCRRTAHPGGACVKKSTGQTTSAMYFHELIFTSCHAGEAKPDARRQGSGQHVQSNWQGCPREAEGCGSRAGAEDGRALALHSTANIRHKDQLALVVPASYMLNLAVDYLGLPAPELQNQPYTSRLGGRSRNLEMRTREQGLDGP